MIDTDKYEGHTPAPWRFGKQEPPLYLRLAIQAGKAKSEDLQLMADAPLLLAEVKRLRSDMAYCASLITCMIDMGDPLSLSVVREGMLDSIGMTVDEAMATTDLMGDEEE